MNCLHRSVKNLNKLLFMSPFQAWHSMRNSAEVYRMPAAQTLHPTSLLLCSKWNTCTTGVCWADQHPVPRGQWRRLDSVKTNPEQDSTVEETEVQWVKRDGYIPPARRCIKQEHLQKNWEYQTKMDLLIFFINSLNSALKRRKKGYKGTIKATKTGSIHIRRVSWHH